MIALIVGVGVGTIGILFGLRCYYELWKWARTCQSARIAIAYKRKVKLQGPLTEWIAWINMLDKDKDSQGRVVYTMGGTSVAITRADAKVSIRFREWVRIRLAKRQNRKTSPPQPNVIEGKWSATDQTPKENHATK